MSYFKIARLVTITLMAWFAITFGYVVLAKFEKPYCFSTVPEGYSFHTFTQYWIENERLKQGCDADAHNVPEGFWIIPMDIFAGLVLSAGGFLYFQFLYKFDDTLAKHC